MTSSLLSFDSLCIIMLAKLILQLNEQDEHSLQCHLASPGPIAGRRPPRPCRELVAVQQVLTHVLERIGVTSHVEVLKLDDGEFASDGLCFQTEIVENVLFAFRGRRSGISLDGGGRPVFCYLAPLRGGHCEGGG